jgi:hypothetical protein
MLDQIPLPLRDENRAQEARDRPAAKFDVRIELPPVEILEELLSPIGVLARPTVTLFDGVIDFHCFQS